jgi:signal transduction histidine kinase
LLPDNSTTAKQIEGRRGYVSEAFHSLNQPLTALHCGLELCLMKERSGEEYRQRIEDAIGNAGTVLQLSKAVRELVEAADPGEDLQKVELNQVLTALMEELAVLGEASMVAVKLGCPEGLAVAADPGKLARHMGNLASIGMHMLAPNGQIQIDACSEGDDVVIAITANGMDRDTVEDGLQKKLDAIRIDAASSYAWSLGGEFCKAPSSFTIRLPALD